tara:strand:+ start:230 stop:1009 length:780 start_codon:yes stop_codon:yes gene_type:complete
MLRPRIIPTLLVQNKGLVKTINFKSGKYVGDPINAVKIFNEKEVDELIVIDIDATVKGESPNFELIKNLAVECRMPLCYGGGIKTVEQAKKIVGLGVEKVAISSFAIEDSKFLLEIGKVIGLQSVVVVLDYKVRKKIFGSEVSIFTHNGTKKINILFYDFIKTLNEIGVGEIVLNSIDNDGLMNGYDINTIKKVREICNVPLTVLGGAGSYSDIKNIIQLFGTIGVSAGSVFVFKGQYKAVLINYPDYREKIKMGVQVV